jgi:hypothetical protein
MWLIIFFFLQPFSDKINQTDYFEGWIKYKHEIVLKNRNIDSVQLQEFIGEGSTLYFKEGNFMHTYRGGAMIQDLYRKDDNKAYFKINNGDTTFWVDCGKPGDEILKISFTPKKEKVLGIDCDELIIFYKNKISTDYYNSEKFGINPNWFKNFILDGQDQIDQKEKAICLKHKTEYSNFIVIQTATAYSKEKIDEKIFKISSNEILVERGE